MPAYQVHENLVNELQISEGSTLSQTIYRDERVKVVLFGFAGGQELPEHAAPAPAIIEILKGNARVTLDNEEKELSAGAWVYMEAKLPHAIYARTNVVMLLTMLTGAAS